LIHHDESLIRSGAAGHVFDRVVTRGARAGGHLPCELLLGIERGSELAELLNNPPIFGVSRCVRGAVLQERSQLGAHEFHHRVRPEFPAGVIVGNHLQELKPRVQHTQRAVEIRDSQDDRRDRLGVECDAQLCHALRHDPQLTVERLERIERAYIQRP
jgi:hypothetical protein